MSNKRAKRRRVGNRIKCLNGPQVKAILTRHGVKVKTWKEPRLKRFLRVLVMDGAIPEDELKKRG